MAKLTNLKTREITVVAPLLKISAFSNGYSPNANAKNGRQTTLLKFKR